MTYANVMATLGVFVALGGTSVAAVSLKRNSVRSKHIKDGQVRSADVGDASLRARDFGDGELPRGPQGEPARSDGWVGGSVGIDLPPGRYLVNGRAHLNNASTTDEKHVDCAFRVNGVDPFTSYRGIADIPPGEMSIPVVGKVEVSGGPGRVRIECNAPAEVTVHSGFTAVPVSQVIGP
jgi:hypothetical protein